MRLYLGPFEWRERISGKTGLPSPPGVFGWRMPVGAIQAIDFRGPQGIESPGSFSPAKALFVTPDSVVLASPFVQIASDPLEQLPPARRRALRDVFEAGTSTATRLIELLHELSTSYTDLSRSIKCPPRIAGRDGRIKHVFAGAVVLNVPVGPGSPEWPGVVARHQAVYRQLRGDGSGILHRKYLGSLIRKYRVSEAVGVGTFIPADLPTEEPLEPTTTLTESFPGTSATLGGDQTWTEVSGVWSNVAGVGSFETNELTSFARCEGALSTDDMRVTTTVTVEPIAPYGGPMVRFAAAATTGYHHNSNRGINDYYCTRVIADSGVDIILSELEGSITLPATDKIEMDGDVVEIFEGANSRGSTTDTNISGNVRGGVGWYFGSGTAVRFDNWQAEDLAALVAAVPSSKIIQQAVHRAASY